MFLINEIVTIIIISLILYLRMIQTAFVDMENMFELLTEEKEVGDEFFNLVIWYCEDVD